MVLVWTTHVGLAVSCVRENVVDLPVFLNQAHFTSRECLELLLLGGSLWNDNFEARGDQQVLFVLRLSGVVQPTAMAKSVITPKIFLLLNTCVIAVSLLPVSYLLAFISFYHVSGIALAATVFLRHSGTSRRSIGRRALDDSAR